MKIKKEDIVKAKLRLQHLPLLIKTGAHGKSKYTRKIKYKNKSNE